MRRPRRKSHNPARWPVWFIGKISLIVPRRFRGEWAREWEAEIRHREWLNRKWERPDTQAQTDLIRRSIGALLDALWLQPRRLEQEAYQDIRYGIRGLLRNPGFTTVALCTLALGMGANTAIFSMINAVVFRPLPYSDPARIYMITGSNSERRTGFLGSDLAMWRQRTQVFSQIATVRRSRMFLSGDGEPSELRGLEITRDCFPLLGTQPSLGRLFTDEDFDASMPRTVIIGNRLWRQAFAAGTEIPGKAIKLNGKSHVIIGIMPPEFQFNQQNCDFWIPLEDDNPSTMEIYARAKPSVTPQQVAAEIDHIFHLLANQVPEVHKPDWHIRATPIQETVVAKARPTMLLLFGAVGFILMIACLNVSNLLLARGADRKKEVAIKTALGASRSRLLRQFLTESFLLAAMGGILGLIVSWWVGKALISLASETTALPRLEQTGIDASVLWFAFCIVFLTNLIFGIIPALQVSKLHLNDALKETGISWIIGFRPDRFRKLLIVAESGLSIILLAGAGLMLRSFYHLITIDPGFKADHILTARLPLPIGEDRRQRLPPIMRKFSSK